MKKLFRNIMIAASLVMGGFSVSCTSVADEITSLDLARCLEPLNLEHTISNGDSVIFSWDLVTGSNQYALQIAEDTNIFESEGGEIIANVISRVVPADEVPYGIKLVADQRYFFRVQAQVADGSKAPSKWAEAIDAVETYAVRSNLNPKVTDRTSTSISISWDVDPDVTHILYTTRDGAEGRYDLTDGDIAAGTATVSGLTPSTDYTVGLYYMSANRGELSLYTKPAFDGSEAVVSTLEGLQAAFKDGAPKVRLTMDGSPYELGQADLVGNMEIYGEEAADGTRPVILGEIHIATASLEKFYSEGIEWNGNGYTNGFLIQLKNGGGLSDVQIGSITYKNCTVTGYSKGIMYEWGQGMNLENYIIDGCTVYDIQGSGGDGFDIRQATTTLGNLTIRNSTIYSGFRSFIRLDADVKVSGKIDLNHNTIMALSTTDESTNNRGVIGIRATDASGKVTVSDNIFLNMTGFSTMISASEANLGADQMAFAGNYFYNVAETFFTDKCSEAAATAGGGSVLAADPCFNSEGLIFNLTNANLISAGAGDPRWLVEYVEPPIDNNLTLITGAKTWDLTDGTIFNGDIDVTQVKDQLRFIASDENMILLENGLIKFTAAGEISRAGIPTAGGLEFIVDKPGSVLIKTADYDDFSGNHVVISLNGTVKGGAATNVNMGNVQKIVITDIAEATSVFLYPSGPIAIESLAWSNDTAQVNTALPAPEVTLDPAMMTQGQATDVTVSWNPVENAASYSVSFNNGSSETVTETSYVIPGSQTGFLQAGGYSVRVFANPAEGDIYNTSSSAGYASLTVLSSGQGGSGTSVASVEDLFNALSAGIGEIELEAGTYDFTSITANGLSEDGVYTIPADLSLKANGDAIVIGAFKFGAGASEVVLDGITFNGNGSIGNFLEDVADQTNATSVIVRNSEITGYTKSFIYVNQASSVIGSIEITGNLIHDMGTGQGTFDMRNGSVGSVTISGNTVYRGCRDIVRADANVTGMSSMVIANNTFADITGGNSNGFARVRAAVAGGITISSNLFLNMLSSNYPFVHTNTTDNNTVNLSNNFFYNFDAEWFSDMDQATATANGGAVLATSPVADIAGADYTLTNAVLMSKKVGDQRWNPQADQPSSSTIEVNSMAEFESALAAGSADITLNAGTYDFSTATSGLFSEGTLTLTSDLSLRGAGAVTVIGSIKLDAGISNFYTYGIVYDGNGAGSFLEVSSESSAIASIAVNGCEIRNYGKSIIYNNKGGSVSEISFFSNLIHDFAGGQDNFDLRKGSYGTLTVQNNTIYNLPRDVFRIDLADGAVTIKTLNVTNNTFSNAGASGKAMFYVRAMVESFNVSSNLFLNQVSKFSRSRTSGAIAPVLSNNFYYNVGEDWFSGDISQEEALANGGAVLETDPVSNAANADFTVTDASVKAAGAGDARWL